MKKHERFSMAERAVLKAACRQVITPPIRSKSDLKAHIALRQRIVADDLISEMKKWR